MVALSQLLTILMTSQVIYAKKLDSVSLVSKEIDWKQFKATWGDVTDATSYKTNLICNTQNFNATVSIATVMYEQVPSNDSCSFNIQALNNADTASDVTSFQFTSAAVPLEPSNLTIINHPDEPTTQLHLTWSHPIAFSANRLKTIRYRITYQDSPLINEFAMHAITDAMANSYTLKDLDKNTIYWVEVSAYDEKTKEIGKVAKGNHLTEKSGMSNLIFALIVLGITIAIITALIIATYSHFKRKYSSV